MQWPYFWSDPLQRIKATHITVVVILALNALLFADNLVAIALQVLLIAAVILYYKDDEKIKKALKQTEQQLEYEKSLFDKNIIISETDLDGIITYVNKKFVSISGYSEAELIGTSHNIIRHPETPSKLFDSLWNSIHNDMQWRGIIQNRRKDGSSYWVDTTILPLFKNGKKIGYKSIRFDVTTSMQIRYQQKMLQTILDTTDEMVLVQETDKITLANTKLLSFLQYPSLDALNTAHQCFCELFLEREGFVSSDKEWVDQVFENEALKNPSKVLMINPATAQEHVFEVRVIPIRRSNSRIVMLRDITALENERISYQQTLFTTQNELKEQSSRFEFAINSSRDGFWDYDIKNKTFFLSSGWKERLGFDADEAVSYIDYMKLIDAKGIASHTVALQEALEKMAHNQKCSYVHFRVQYPLTTKRGEHLVIEDVGDIYCRGNNEPERITGFHRDITEQIRQNKIIENQNRLNAMGEMISNIAHQWRQPIAAINNVLNDAELDIELEDAQSISKEQFFNTSTRVKELTQHLSKTIDDFRNLSSDEKHKERFDIDGLIAETYGIVKNSLEAHGIDFEAVTSEEGIHYEGYRRELMQVLLNILNNARDALVQFKVSQPQININVTKDDDALHITLCDNAGGIPSHIMDKIFEPYYTTKHQSVGTGIGLYMSRKIILEHFHGQLEVSNREGGACFSITLPY